MTIGSIPPVVQIVGYSDTGKTTLLSRLVRHLTQEGWRVGTIKHHAGELEMDQRGKDSWYHREAGADPVAITAANQTALIIPRSLGLAELLPLFRGLDLVLVEGFKRAPYPKLVMLRESAHLSQLKELSNVWGVVSSHPLTPGSLPVYQREDIEGIVHLLKERVLQDTR
ncbi:molybdopterin-guanine dinucleotide biosynthesis protein MobB [Kroppenstedtia sanguinis]|uniref:molybdopterin-guanine dinucleotide biosynthesis protein B n=1 Tax=Kroppenstedtia sanguinis TaxID=1380684 RepID=UPI003D208B41